VIQSLPLVAIHAENPLTFTPLSGRIPGFHVPGGIGARVDTTANTAIAPYRDSPAAKRVVPGGDRAEAIHRMPRTLEMFVLEGIQTFIPLHQRILAVADFPGGRFDTNVTERYLPPERGAH
jgi:acetyl-CoA carboxylase, biotin carboxylase subunit